MGYTHHWTITDVQAWRRMLPKLIQDAELIIAESGVRIGGPNESIVIEYDSLTERELAQLGIDPKTVDLSLLTLQSSPPILDEEKGIQLNGYHDDGHQPLQLHDTFGLTHKGRVDHFCKTARKPYDVVVTCILLRAFMLDPTAIELGSDGRWHGGDWDRARALHAKLWPEEEIICPLED